MSVNKERLQLALDALRSGEYIQGQRSLAPIVDGVQKFCCLGVLCEVAIENGVEGLDRIQRDSGVGYETTHITNHGNRYVEWSVLPREARDWYGFDAPIPAVWDEDFDHDDEVSLLNDYEGWTFDMIADGFQRTYIDVEDES